jgi:hypothetical protein
MPRIALLGAAASLALALAGVALAQPAGETKLIEDPQGRFSFEAPKAWPVDNETSATGRTAILAGVDPECQFHAVMDPSSVTVSPDGVKRAWTAPIGTVKWTESLNAFKGRLFDNGGVGMTVSDEAVDASGFFPVQKAKASAGGMTVSAAMYPRPGMVVWSFCRTWKSADPSAVYAAVQSSFKTPQDEAMAAVGAANEAQGAAAAAQAKADAPNAAPQPKEQPPAEPARRKGMRGGARN